MSKLAPGRYHARILYHSLSENSAGNPDLRIAVLPYSDPSLPLPPGYSPTPLLIYLTLTDGTIGTPELPGWVSLTLQSLGFNSTDLATLDPEGECPFSFVGREVIILGATDSYKGKERVRWNILRNQGESKPLPADRLRALAERHKATLAAMKPIPPADETVPWDTVTAPPEPQLSDAPPAPPQPAKPTKRAKQMPLALEQPDAPMGPYADRR